MGPENVINRILALLPVFFLMACATANEPPARLPVPDPQPLTQEQEDLVPIIKLCSNKAKLAVVIFAARQEGKTEEEVLERVEKITGETEMHPAVRIDFYRMTRDIFRKDTKGNYKIPGTPEYIKKFSTVEYRSCKITHTSEDCTLLVSELEHAETYCPY